MKKTNTVICILAMIVMVLPLCSCDNLVRNREREKVVNEFLMMKKQLPVRVKNTDMMMTDIDIEGDTVVMTCSVTNEYWETMSLSYKKANTDRNVARVVESFDESYLDKFITSGLGLKYVYTLEGTGKRLFEISASAERLKDIKDRVDRGVLKPYTMLELSQIEIDNMQFPSEIEEGVWLTSAYIRGNTIFYEARLDAEVDPKYVSAADVAEMRRGILEELKKEKLVMAHNKEIVAEGIHFVYIYKDNRGVEFARVDISPDEFM